MSQRVRFSSWITRVLAAFPLPEQRFPRAIFWALLGVGIVLRMGGLDWGVSHTVSHSSPVHDEVHALYALQIPWQEYWTTYSDYEIIQGIFIYRLFSRPLVALTQVLGINAGQNQIVEYVIPRLLVSVFGILGLVAIYLLGRALGGTRAGLFTLALLVFLPGHWGYSQLIKSEVPLATFLTLLLLAGFRIIERGGWKAAAAGGLLTGAAFAFKSSALPFTAILLLAHLCAWIWRKPRWKSALRNLAISLATSVVVFLLLFPYPYMGFARWWGIQTTLPNNTPQFPPPTVATLRATWNAFTRPNKMFLTVVAGPALRWVFPVMAAAFIGSTLLALRAGLGARHLLVLASAFLMFWSLSFFPAYSDRYLIPFIPFVVLFPSLIAAAAVPGMRIPQAVRWAATVFGGVMVAATASITLAQFPSFAVGADVREQVATYLRDTMSEGEAVGDFEPGTRHGLPLDRSRLQIAPLLRKWQGNATTVYRATSVRYLVAQQEPDNYDPDLRQLVYDPNVRAEFTRLLEQYRVHRVFGREPVLFGRPLPRKIWNPVYVLYERVTPEARKGENTLPASWSTEGELFADPHAPFDLTRSRLFRTRRTWANAELADRLLEARLDLSGIERRWKNGEEIGGTVALVLLFDDATIRPDLPSNLSEVTFLTKDAWWGIAVALHPREVRGTGALTFAFDFRPDGAIDVYSGPGTDRIARSIGTKSFKTVRVGIAVLPSAPSSAVMHLADLTLREHDH
ncbi:MAG: 4-amino-4-deoxy-L-arabinose transferase [Parcubacteria group bacterium Gr01-1014_38]|nr:MAG: 4-amino-4-deoxy-L-arabinose transferase [Parcubacteria group bacterium Gr01-1014_38]